MEHFKADVEVWNAPCLAVQFITQNAILLSVIVTLLLFNCFILFQEQEPVLLFVHILRVVDELCVPWQALCKYCKHYEISSNKYSQGTKEENLFLQKGRRGAEM